METNKTKKLALLIIAVFTVFLIFNNESKGQQFVPVKDAEVIGLLKQLVKKEFELDPAAREIAGINLNNMNDFIIQTLKTMGRKGDINDTGELNVFVNNWRNFSLEGQYRAEDLWRGILYVGAYGNQQLEIPPLLCDHIRNSPAFRSLLPREVNNLIQSKIRRKVNALEEYLVTSKCDSFVNENYETFLNDFNAGGGWEMFEKLSQPQNNVFGAINLAMDELERQRQIEEQSDLQEANSGSGYLGRRQCLSSGPAGQCVIWSNVNIPANLAVETLGALINQNLAWFVTTDEAGEDSSAVNIVELIEEIFGRIAP
ncbi:MAG: hypothetical protein AAB338_02495 [Patescibacteria group bacterium]